MAFMERVRAINLVGFLSFGYWLSRSWWSRVLGLQQIGIASIGILVIYGLGAMPYVDFRANALSQEEFFFIDGFVGILRQLPYAAWFYAGIENLNLASNEVKAPKTTIPGAQVSGVWTLFLTGILTFFVTVALPGGGGVLEIAKNVAPLNNGFHHMLSTKSNAMTLFSIPATYGVAYGFMWSYGRLIHSMAISGLYPAFLARSSSEYGTSYAAIAFGSAIGYISCLVVQAAKWNADDVFLLCLLAAFISYSGQCIGYICLKVLYPAIAQSHYQSPFGVPGAAFALVIWLLGIVSILALQERALKRSFTALLILLFVTLFYVLYARHRQRLSPEEQRVLMVAHVAKFNAMRRHQLKRQGSLRGLRKGGSARHLATAAPTVVFGSDIAQSDGDVEETEPQISGASSRMFSIASSRVFKSSKIRPGGKAAPMRSIQHSIKRPASTLKQMVKGNQG